MDINHVVIECVGSEHPIRMEASATVRGLTSTADYVFAGPDCSTEVRDAALVFLEVVEKDIARRAREAAGEGEA